MTGNFFWAPLPCVPKAIKWPVLIEDVDNCDKSELVEVFCYADDCSFNVKYSNMSPFFDEFDIWKIKGLDLRELDVDDDYDVNVDAETNDADEDIEDVQTIDQTEEVNFKTDQKKMKRKWTEEENKIKAKMI